MATDYLRRLEALEERIEPSSRIPTLIWRNIGETSDEAIARYCAECGVRRDSIRNVAVIGWKSPFK